MDSKSGWMSCVGDKWILTWVVWVHGRYVDCERTWEGLAGGSCEWLCGRQLDPATGRVDAWYVNYESGCTEGEWIMKRFDKGVDGEFSEKLCGSWGGLWDSLSRFVTDGLGEQLDLWDVRGPWDWLSGRNSRKNPLRIIMWMNLFHTRDRNIRSAEST